MPLQSQPELFWLAAVAVMTGVLWIPHILWLLAHDPVKTLINRSANLPIEAEWAQRAKRAHTNALENLAVFAPLVLIVQTQHLTDGLTASAASAYFFARAAHFIVYTSGIPVLRTLAFFVGVGCQAIFALRLFGLL